MRKTLEISETCVTWTEIGIGIVISETPVTGLSGTTGIEGLKETVCSPGGIWMIEEWSVFFVRVSDRICMVFFLQKYCL